MILGIALGAAPPPATSSDGPPFSGDLVAFFDADDDASFVLDGGAVVSWASRVGTVQAVPHAPEFRPLRSAGLVNGRSAVVGETGKFLPFADASPLPTESMSVFFVGGASGGNTGYGPGWGESQNVSGDLHFNINASYSEGLFFPCLELPGGGDCSEAEAPDSAVHIVGVLFSPAVGAGQDTVSGFLDGAPFPSSPITTTTLGFPPTVGGITWYGADPGDNDGWDGPVCELLVYGRVLSDNEREQVESYLSAKWGVA